MFSEYVYALSARSSNRWQFGLFFAMFFWHIRTNIKASKHFVSPVWEMRCFIREISELPEGYLQERKCTWGLFVKYKTFSVVCMINPELQFAAESDLVCSFTGFGFQVIETKDEGTYWGYYRLSSFSITLGPVDSDNPLLAERIF